MPVPDQPDLTVAIPTFHGSRHLAAALRSILAQEGAAFELLICDDRSEDDTVSLVREEVGDRARASRSIPSGSDSPATGTVAWR